MLPEAIGPYRVLGLLGEGGMGVVYRAVREGDEPSVAVKTVRVPRGRSVASIRAEIVALSRLQHPSIVRILGEGVADGLPWYAMDLLEGSTLRDHLDAFWAEYGGVERGNTNGSGVRAPVAGGRLAEALTLMRRLCAPLAYLHGRGIVHRDLKPGNVVIRSGGEPVLMDFGLVSQFFGGFGREALEVGGLLVGTAAYMAPEQAMGLLVDARADLYAFGIMLYEVLTGRVPFTGPSMRELLQQHVSNTPAPPSALVEGVSHGLDALVMRLLEKRPRKRFGYAEDVAAALAELGADPSPEVVSRTYLYRAELSGREAALGTLERSLDRLRETRAGGLVLIGGESGVGKTSLVARAARNATLAHLSVVTGECLPIAIHGSSQSMPLADASHLTALDVTGAPLHPFRSFLLAIADSCREGGREVTDRLLGQRGRVLAPYEPALADLPGQREQPAKSELSVEAAHQRLLNDLAATLSAYVDHVGPTLLVLDDLQWADELSLSFLKSLSPEDFERMPLLIFGTYRSDEVSDPLGELMTRPGVARIELGRLDEQTLGAIVGDMLALAKPPRPFVHFLARHSEGNPFFVAEYLRAAVEEGLLRREAGTWGFADRSEDAESRAEGPANAESRPMPKDFESLPLPRSLREIVGRRLQGLGEQALRVLEVAAVLGRDVDAALLAEALGAAEEEALGAVKDLSTRQVLVPAEDGHHRFAHDKLREVAYARISPERRRELHAAAAAALERRLAASAHLALHHGELAHHWTAAEVWSKAVHYMEKAGEQALRDFSNRDAVRFFKQALALGARMEEPPGPLQLARWERSLVEAHQGLGEDALGREHAEMALRHCRRPVPTTPPGLLLGCLIQIAIRVFRSYLPARQVTSPVKRALLLEAAFVSQRMLEPAFRDNAPLLGVYCGMRSLNLAERVPPSPPLARGYAFMCMIVGLTPLTAVALSWSDRALRIAEEIGSEPLLIYCLSRVGCYSTSAARFREAEAQLGRAAAMAQRLGDLRQLDESRTLLGIAHHANGRFEESVRLGREELASGAARGDLQTQGWARSRLAQSLTRLGHPAEAITLIEASKGWIEGVAEDTEALWAEAAAALAQLAAGRPEAARRAADSALARMKKHPPVQFYLGASCAELVEVYLALWEGAAGSPRSGEIAAAARSAVGILTRFARMVAFIRPAALRARGTQAWLDGRAALAHRLWQKALAEAERLEMRYERGQAHLTIGLRATPAEARTHLGAALALFTQLGATGDALRAREALDEVAD